MYRVLILLICLTLPTLAQSSHKHLGEVFIGQSKAEFTSITGKPAKTDAVVFEAATGEYLQKWHYPKLGLVAEMGSAEKNGAQKVYRLEASAPNKWKAFGGVSVGSPVAKVEQALKKAEGKNTEVHRDQEGGNYGILWNETYLSVGYEVADGKVKKIYLGPGPE